MSTYIELLKHPKWQKKRLQILSRDNFTCQDCFDDEKTLHVHHKIYTKGAKPWEYEDVHLITLCEDCHSLETESLKIEEKYLVEAFKSSQFLSGQWHEIYLTIAALHKVHDPEVMARSVGWFLRSEDNLRSVIDMYFDYLSKKSSDKTIF